MIRGTTPTISYTLAFDTSLIEAAYITIRSKDVEVEKSIKDCVLSENTISATLTQEETLKLPPSQIATVQLRVRTKAGDASATPKLQIKVEDILKEGVI